MLNLEHLAFCAFTKWLDLVERVFEATSLDERPVLLRLKLHLEDKLGLVQGNLEKLWKFNHGHHVKFARTDSCASAVTLVKAEAQSSLAQLGLQSLQLLLIMGTTLAVL